MKKLLLVIATLLATVLLAVPTQADDGFYLTPSSTFKDVNSFMRTYVPDSSPGSDYGYSTDSISSVSSTVAETEPDWSTYTEPHNYGIAGLEIPTGAIGVKDSENAGIMCLEGDLLMGYEMNVETPANGDPNIYDSEGNLIGEITVYDGGPYTKNYQLDYGYIYPQLMFIGGKTLDDECLPSWYVAIPTKVVEYVWDPNLDISESSTAIAETIECTEGYKLEIVIDDGFVRDAANNENMYWHDMASYNATIRKLSYPWSGAVIGRMDDATGTTGFICAQNKELLSTAAPDPTPEPEANDEPETNDEPEANDEPETNDEPEVVDDTSIRSYFYDIPANQYYTEPVLDFAEKGYIEKEANYNPGEAITRGDLAEMIIKASERELVSSFNATFTDVPSTHPQAVYIYTGVRDGLWSGKSATQFDPEGKLIRAELAKILANERGLTDEGTGVTFEDWDKTQDWAKPYILRVNEAGIMTGVGDKRNFEPFGTLTRADTTTALWRIFESVMSSVMSGDPGGE